MSRLEVVQPKVRAVSYVRYSTPLQRLGLSYSRQLKATAAYIAKHDLVLDETLQDEGLSGYHGKHMRNGALGRFVKRVDAGEIEPGCVLIVEALDRLSRQKPRIAAEQLLHLVNCGIEVVTLMDNQRYSGDSMDANFGQIFMSVGIMVGAHAESANKAERIADSWANGRRGENNATNMLPGWFIKTVDGKPAQSVKGAVKRGCKIGIKLDSAKAKTIRRIFKMVLETGTREIATRLNAEGIPTLASRKTARGFNVWTQNTISDLVRGEQVLGRQKVGRMKNGKRELTGETLNAYLPVVTLDKWQAANAAIDSRSKGIHTGHNRIQYANLFGMAKCGQCGGRMTIRCSGKEKVKYLSCANASTSYKTKWRKAKPSYVKVEPTCDNRRYFRLSHLERDTFRLFSGLTWQADDRTDRAKVLVNMLDEARTAEAKAKSGLAKAIARDVDESVIADAGKDHRAKLALVAKLERELAITRTAKPGEAHLASFQTISYRLSRLEGAELTESRGKIATALASLLGRLAFMPSGEIVATLATGKQIVLGDGWQGNAIPSGFLLSKPILAKGRNSVARADVAAVLHDHPEKHREALEDGPSPSPVDRAINRAMKARRAA